MKRDLAEVISKAMDCREAQLRVCIPGSVVAYYPATQTADVQPAIASVMDLEDGPLVEHLPLLYNVPVEFPRGGGYLLMFPLNPLDTGMLEFTDFSIDLWRSTGVVSDAAAPSGPNDLRTHSLGSAIFRPGISPAARVVAAPPTGLLLGSEAGTLPIQLGSSSATDFVALASLVSAQLSALKTAIQNASVTPNDGGLALKTNILAALSAWPSSVASAVVKSV